MGLRTKIGLAMTLVLLLGVATTVFVEGQDVRQSRQAALKSQETMAHLIGDLLDGVLENSLQEMTEYVGDLALSSPRDQVKTAVGGIERAFFISGLQAPIEEAFFVDAAGNVTGSFLSTPADVASVSFYDLWPLVDPQWPKVYGETEALAGRPLVFLSVPLGKSDGALVIGVVMTERTLLSSFTIHDFMVGETGFVQVNDQHGHVLARSTPKTPRAADMSIEEFDSKYLTTVVPVNVAPWSVLVRQLSEEVLAPVDGLRDRMVLASVIVLVFAVVSTWLVTRNAVSRIRRLKDASVAMTGGDLERQVPQLGTDEIGGLARALEAMRLGLKKANADADREAHAASEARARSEADRLKSEFLGSMAHQLRTPLTTVKGYSTSLLREDVVWSDHDRKRFLTEIDRKADELDGLITKLLQATRIEGDAVRLVKKPVVLSRLVEEIIESFSSSHDKHVLTSEFPKNFPIIQADADYLVQALWNLVENAAKYSPDGGRVTVVGSVSQDGVVVSIRDNGIGIAPEHLDKLFSRFYRVDDEANRTVRGTGLGLYITKALVEAHGGKVWVESKPGEGSTFFVSLPTDYEFSRSLKDE